MWSTALFVLILLRITIAQTPTYLQCDDPKLRPDFPSCQQFVETVADCQPTCTANPFVVCFPEMTVKGRLICTKDYILPANINSLASHHSKLDAHLRSKFSPSVSPLIFSDADQEDRPAMTIVVEPLVARIIEVDEKQQSIGVMLGMEFTWVDYRLAWNPSEFGNIQSMSVTRDAIWRPPIFPLNSLSFSNDDAIKQNVQVSWAGVVEDATIWNFRQAVQMKFDDFPYDRQTFYIQLARKDPRMRMIGPQYIVTESESETEWQIVEDFEKVNSSIPAGLTYKVVMKRFPYFWAGLIIVPCFILGFLVIAALTLGADTNTIEGLVNIGLAASVSSAVVVSAMTDHFPKTEKVPSIATFVKNQFIIIVSALITLAIRKVFMPKINAALEKWQKTENNEELSAMEKTWIFAVKVLKHRLFLFVIFGIAYSVCFGLVAKHMDLNFDRKKRKFVTGKEHLISFVHKRN